MSTVNSMALFFNAMRKMNSILTVSYTHLDVYKRQVLTVEIPPISVGTEICVCFPDSCRLRRNNVSELSFRFLNRAEMEFNRKAGLYETCLLYTSRCV